MTPRQERKEIVLAILEKHPMVGPQLMGNIDEVLDYEEEDFQMFIRGFKGNIKRIEEKDAA